jgi:protein AroM
MKKIGMLTIGQSPRDDIVPALKDILGGGYEIVEAGALDDLSLENVGRIEFGPEDYPLVSRMRDGTEVRITKRFVLPLLQRRIHELEEKGVRLIVVMCTGKFPPFESRGLVVTPQEILRGVLKGALKKGRLGVVYPAKEQMRGARSEFEREGVEVYTDHLSPYQEESELDDLADRLRGQDLDLIFLNCFGFTSKIKQVLAERTGRPVIQSNALIARVLKELMY